MSPLKSSAYWSERPNRYSWSGDPWLDRLHDRLVRRALGPLLSIVGRDRRGRGRTLNVGDERHVDWLEDRGLRVLSIDVLLEGGWPWDSIGADPEAMSTVPGVADFQPDLVVAIDSLSVYANWPAIIRQARLAGATWLIVLDDFSQPTPAWKKGLRHRNAIEWDELVATAGLLGYDLVESVAVDKFHRKLFLATPAILHPLVFAVTLVLDTLAQELLEAREARHAVGLFRTKSVSHG